MLATAALVLSSFVATFALGSETQLNISITTGQPWNSGEDLLQQGNMFVNVNTSGRPWDCQDLIQQGKTYEGHYVVYGKASAAPKKPSIIYCSQDDGMDPLPSDKNPPRNCLDLLHDGISTSGVNVIYPYLEHPNDPVLVLCDQETDMGGWTVIQNRFDGSENFYRDWADYVDGFGNPNEEHYIGNFLIASLTGQSANELRVELEDWHNEQRYAHYQIFYVDPIHDYQLQVALYDGNAGDSLDFANVGQPFSTFDADHVSDDNYNCAELRHSAWWYARGEMINVCSHSNLNGRYYPSADTGDAHDGIWWDGFNNGWHSSFKSSKMMIRPHTGAATNTA